MFFFISGGKTGVFDLAELVDLLRKENCIEVMTIAIPKEIDYADHMIIVTCKYVQLFLHKETL